MNLQDIFFKENDSRVILAMTTLFTIVGDGYLGVLILGQPCQGRTMCTGAPYELMKITFKKIRSCSIVQYYFVGFYCILITI